MSPMCQIRTLVKSSGRRRRCRPRIAPPPGKKHAARGPCDPRNTAASSSGLRRKFAWIVTHASSQRLSPSTADRS